MNKRLLFITPGLGKGGAETQLLKIARYCKINNIEVMIIVLNPINNFEENWDSLGIKVIILRSWKTYFRQNFRNLNRSINEFKPQIVVAFMFIAIIFARLLKMRFKFKLISSIRNSVISRKWRFLFKITSKMDDVIVYNAIASKFNFEKRGLTKNNGIVVNNAIFIPLIKGGLDEVSRQFVWISMAHFRPSKDYQTLFKAIPLIKHQNFRIDIIGHLKGQVWPQQMIEDFGIQDKVRLLGFKSNSQDYLEKADALVLSSFNEGMPNAILEAMAYSKPIIGSEIDGIRELLIDSKCGFLFKQGSPEDLANKMDRVMDMTALERYDLGSRGREHVKKYFAENVILDDWLKIILPLFPERGIHLKK